MRLHHCNQDISMSAHLPVPVSNLRCLSSSWVDCGFVASVHRASLSSSRLASLPVPLFWECKGYSTTQLFIPTQFIHNRLPDVWLVVQFQHTLCGGPSSQPVGSASTLPCSEVDPREACSVRVCSVGSLAAKLVFVELTEHAFGRPSLRHEGRQRCMVHFVRKIERERVR